jgi:AAA15 family ATPase/GTPase
MIKSIYIDNFKALNNFNIDLKPLTVLIGANGSGKRRKGTFKEIWSL